MEQLEENHKQLYLALVGDVMASRDLGSTRGVAQERLFSLIEQVNREHGSDLAVGFSVSRGDEFEGLLSDPATALALIESFEGGADGFAFRFGVGWGAVTTAFRGSTYEMDGPCFQGARAAIERAKKEHRWVCVSGLGEDGDAVLNATFRLIQDVREGWTDKQRASVALRRRHGTLTAAAAELGISKSALSVSLKASHYKSLLEAEAALRILLRDGCSNERESDA